MGWHWTWYTRSKSLSISGLVATWQPATRKTSVWRVKLSRNSYNIGTLQLNNQYQRATFCLIILSRWFCRVDLTQAYWSVIGKNGDGRWLDGYHAMSHNKKSWNKGPRQITMPFVFLVGISKHCGQCRVSTEAKPKKKGMIVSKGFRFQIPNSYPSKSFQM